jgi:hypothetical protein
LFETDSTLEGWVEAASEPDLQVLKGLGERMSRWTPSDSQAAGFALATWVRLEGVAVDEWFRDYRRVLGVVVCTDVEAQAAYRGAQLKAATLETAMTWAEDRWDEAANRLPEVFTALDEHRLAMERAAQGVAAARELRSREVGITVGPRDDPSWHQDFEEAVLDGYPGDFLTFAAPAPAVGDSKEAVERCREELSPLRDRRRSVERHLEYIVESCGAHNRESLDALRANFLMIAPRAEVSAAKGHFPIPVGVQESLRMEHVQGIAAERYIELMGTAGELRLGVAGPPDPSERRASYDRTLEAAGRERKTVGRLADALDRRREPGRDASMWLASGECDDLRRGFALHAVGSQMERERVRHAARNSPKAGMDHAPPEIHTNFKGPEADHGFGI